MNKLIKPDQHKHNNIILIVPIANFLPTANIMKF